jgi:hypothetical protein
VDVNAFEAELSERIEIEDRMAAEHLAPDPGDYGDWLYEQQKDRDSMRDESMEAEWRRAHGVEDRR